MRRLEPGLPPAQESQAGRQTQGSCNQEEGRRGKEKGSKENQGPEESCAQETKGNRKEGQETSQEIAQESLGQAKGQ